MSERENIALVQSLYAAFGEGNVDYILSKVADNVEWRLDGPSIIPFAGLRTTREEVAGFFKTMGETQTAQQLTTTEWIAIEDKVVTLGRYSATVKSTGKRMEAAVVHVFTIRDGKVARFLDFTDTAQAADAYTQASAATR